MPIIYAHRGLWINRAEQNSLKAINSAVEHGFGIETDFRSDLGELVLSHDPIIGREFIRAAEINLENVPIAMNIKEDGLKFKFQRFLELNHSSRTFLFDGSIPEMLQIKKLGLPHALRLSEFETEIAWEAPYLWVDAFNSDWWVNSENIMKLAERYFLIFVSPELHLRDQRKSWDYLFELNQRIGSEFGICTDFPMEFASMFNA